MVNCKMKGESGEISYPCIMKSKYDGAVVLFTSRTNGTTLCRGKGVQPVGKYMDCWNNSSFEPIIGVLELSNG